MEVRSIIEKLNSGDIKQQFSALDNLFSCRVSGLDEKKQIILQLLAAETHPGVRFKARKILNKIEKLLEQKSTESTVRPGTAIQLAAPDSSLEHALKLVSECPEKILASSRDQKLNILKRINLKQINVPVSVLLQLLSTENDVFVIATLVKSIAITGGAEHVDTLIPYTRCRDPRIRANAVEALSRTGDEQVYVHIVPLLKDEDHRVRGNAVKALRDTGSENVFSCLEEMISSGKENFIRSAVYALQMISENDRNAETRNLLLQRAEMNLQRMDESDIVFNDVSFPTLGGVSSDSETGTDVADFCTRYFMDAFYNSLSFYSNLYITSEIPDRKVRNFIKSFSGPGIAAEIWLIFYDCSLLGSGKKGLLMTHKALYVRSDKNCSSINLEGLENIRLESDSNLIINEYLSINLHRTETVARKHLAAFFRKIQGKDFEVKTSLNPKTAGLSYREIKDFTSSFFRAHCTGASRISEYLRLLDDVDERAFNISFRSYVRGFQENEGIIATFSDRTNGKKGFILSEKNLYFSDGKKTGRIIFESIHSLELLRENGQSVLHADGRPILTFSELKHDVYPAVNQYFFRLFNREFESVHNDRPEAITLPEKLEQYTQDFFLKNAGGIRIVQNFFFTGENIPAELNAHLIQEFSEIASESLLFMILGTGKSKSFEWIGVTSINLYYSSPGRKGHISLGRLDHLNILEDQSRHDGVVSANGFEVLRFDSSHMWFARVLSEYFHGLSKSSPVEIPAMSNRYSEDSDRQKMRAFTNDYYNLLLYRNSDARPESLEILPERHKKIRKKFCRQSGLNIPDSEEILLFHEDRLLSRAGNAFALTDRSFFYRCRTHAGFIPLNQIVSISADNVANQMMITVNSREVICTDRFSNDFDKIFQTYIRKLIKGDLIVKKERNFKLLSLTATRVQQFSDAYFRILHQGLRLIPGLLFVGNIPQDDLTRIQKQFCFTLNPSEELLLSVTNERSFETGFVLTTENFYHSSGIHRSSIPFNEICTIDWHVSEGKKIIMMVNEYRYITIEHIYLHDLLSDYFSRIITGNVQLDILEDRAVMLNIDRQGIHSGMRFLERICFKRLCFSKYVVVERFNQARTAYAWDASMADLIVFFDDSDDFSGDSGFLLTLSEFHYSLYRHAARFAGSIPLSELRTLEFKAERQDSPCEVHINGVHIGDLRKPSCHEADVLTLLGGMISRRQFSAHETALEQIDKIQRSQVDDLIFSRLAPLFEPDEKIIYSSTGINTLYSHDNVVCTNLKLYVSGKDLFGIKEHLEGYSYEMITHISVRSGTKGPNVSLTEKMIDDGLSAICSICGICDIQFIFEGKEFMISNIRQSDAAQAVKIVKVMHMDAVMHSGKTEAKAETMDVVKKLKDLKELLDTGIISESDYIQSKNRILESML